MDLGALLHKQAVATPDAVALLCADQTMTFGELDRSTDRLAAWLLARGLHPGARVGFQCPTAFAVVQVFFAALKAGLIAVPINLRLNPTGALWIVEHSGAALPFAPPPFA